ncbi:MAG: 1-acyl-sn-glycerol-3-phosphate acyltransferase [Clostridia bacterium]|nr:1-acyl-sn-glycerol-3-phosphate acyltransferase [Clostridia bacterium]
MEQSKERLEVLEKMAEYEKNGWFYKDLENDPPTRPLDPGECDYTQKKLSSKIGTKIANAVGKNFFEKCIKRGELVIKEIKGIENFIAVKDGGVVITANHFNPFDNYAVYKAIEPHMKRQNLYKVIREGNYTTYGGLYGYLFRNCNTLPIASSVAVFKEFSSAVSVLLKKGEKILIYPEQGMWWNYRKPRPLKTGAFRFASQNNVPVLPVFITLEDTDKIGDDGFAVQAYTVNILPAIYPKADATVRENSVEMAKKNYEMWKEVYESFYGEKLEYTTESEVKPCYT